eukprot:m.43896 g.43896  ORF g.43896 m.43896 type:complete len:392 (+) comp14491_c0_seq1:231-1406(+)
MDGSQEGAAVQHTQTLFIVLLFADPHVSEALQVGQNRATKPGGVNAVRRSRDLDFDVLLRLFLHFLQQTLAKLRKGSGATRQHNVGEQLAAQVHVGLLNRVHQHLVDSLALFANIFGRKQDFWRTETRVANLNGGAVGQHKALLVCAVQFHALLFARVQCHVALLFLHLPHNLELGRRAEELTFLSQKVLQAPRHVTASHVGAHDGVLHSKALENGHSLRDAVTAVQNNARCAAAGVQGKGRLDGDVKGAYTVLLEEHVSGLLAVFAGVECGLGQQNRVIFFVGNVESASGIDVTPQALHVVPALHNAVFHGVFQVQQTAVILCALAHEKLALQTSHQNALVLGCAHHAWAEAFGLLVASKASLDFSRSIVNDNGLAGERVDVIGHLSAEL